MKRCWICSLIGIAVLCLGCVGTNKMRMPLAEIDRPLVNPKGTWSARPQLSAYITTNDSITYRGYDLRRWANPSYSITDNLALIDLPFPYFIYPGPRSTPNIQFPTIVWQLTKSPLVDTMARNKWMFALSEGTNLVFSRSILGGYGLQWKKRLGPSVWYGGGFSGTLYYYFGEETPYYSKGTKYFSNGISSGIGFQLSPKADVVSLVNIGYGAEYLNRSLKFTYWGGSGSFNFHYSFSPWFSVNYGSGLSIEKVAMSLLMNVGGEFYW
jgi:hypothetical protein